MDNSPSLLSNVGLCRLFHPHTCNPLLIVVSYDNQQSHTLVDASFK